MSSRAKRKGCTRKLFLTESEAIGWATRASKSGKRQLRAYKCPHCRGWHLAVNRHKQLDMLFKQIEDERKERQSIAN